MDYGKQCRPIMAYAAEKCCQTALLKAVVIKDCWKRESVKQIIEQTIAIQHSLYLTNILNLFQDLAATEFVQVSYSDSKFVF